MSELRNGFEKDFTIGTKSSFESGFAPKLYEMLEFREAMGFKNDAYLPYLKKFDDFCAARYPVAAGLTETIVKEWAATPEGSLSSSARAIRAFAEYLQTMGEDAYALPESYSPGKGAANTYIFTDSELSAVFREIDSIKPTATAPFIDVIAPVMFRLTYTRGLRPNESRELMTENVNLDTGEILITHTKKHRERMVVTSDDMLNMCRAYDTQRRLFAGDSQYFFPNPQGAAFAAPTIDKLFKACWAKANPDVSKGELPAVRVYTLRHQFASARLSLWLDGKQDLMVKLPYLRAYMGHNRMDDTLYYVHLLPERLVKSDAIDWNTLDDVLPGVSL